MILESLDDGLSNEHVHASLCAALCDVEVRVVGSEDDGDIALAEGGGCLDVSKGVHSVIRREGIAGDIEAVWLWRGIKRIKARSQWEREGVSGSGKVIKATEGLPPLPLPHLLNHVLHMVSNLRELLPIHSNHRYPVDNSLFP